MRELEFAPEAVIPLGIGKTQKAVFGDFCGEGGLDLVLVGNSFLADTLEMRTGSMWAAKLARWEKDLPVFFRPHRLTSPRPLSAQAVTGHGPRAELVLFDGTEAAIYENGAFDGGIRFRCRQVLFRLDDEARRAVRGELSQAHMINGDAREPGDVILGTRDLGDYYPPLRKEDVEGLPFPEAAAKRYDDQGRWLGKPSLMRLYICRAHAGGKGVYGRPEPVVDADRKPIELPFGWQISVADLDGDGDLDILYGTENWHLGFIEDVGRPGEPQWVCRGKVKDVDGGPMRVHYSYTAPVVVDFNGRIGVVSSTGGGWLLHCSFKGMQDNVPVLADPVHLHATGGGGLGRDGFLTPAAIDFHRKGVHDIICGCEHGTVMVFRNEGTPGQPRFTSLDTFKDTEGAEIRQWSKKHGRGDLQGPAEDEWGYTGVTAGDWCGDGLQDIMAADSLGEVYLYRNVGTATEPRFAPGQALRQGGRVFQTVWRHRPWIVDFDGDGKSELVALDPYGHATLYRRPDASDPFVIDEGTLLPLEDGKPLKLDGSNAVPGSWQGRSNLCVADLDADGRLDILVGWGAGYQESDDPKVQLARFRFATVKWFRNVGSNAAPKFRPGGYLRHDGWPIVAGGHNCAVHAVDWDGDGKLELIFGTDNGQLCVLDHNEFTFDIP
jgi:hypothetical protein